MISSLADDYVTCVKMQLNGPRCARRATMSSRVPQSSGMCGRCRVSSPPCGNHRARAARGSGDGQGMARKGKTGMDSAHARSHAEDKQRLGTQLERCGASNAVCSRQGSLMGHWLTWAVLVDQCYTFLLNLGLTILSSNVIRSLPS